MGQGKKENAKKIRSPQARSYPGESQFLKVREARRGREILGGGRERQAKSDGSERKMQWCPAES